MDRKLNEIVYKIFFSDDVNLLQKILPRLLIARRYHLLQNFLFKEASLKVTLAYKVIP